MKDKKIRKLEEEVARWGKKEARAKEKKQGAIERLKAYRDWGVKAA